MDFELDIQTNVLFIPYFCLFVSWYFRHFSCMVIFQFFFPSCPSCLGKCKQRLCNIFVSLVTLLPKVTKDENKKWDERNISWFFSRMRQNWKYLFRLTHLFLIFGKYLHNHRPLLAWLERKQSETLKDLFLAIQKCIDRELWTRGIRIN